MYVSYPFFIHLLMRNYECSYWYKLPSNVRMFCNLENTNVNELLSNSKISWLNHAIFITCSFYFIETSCQFSPQNKQTKNKANLNRPYLWMWMIFYTLIWSVVFCWVKKKMKKMIGRAIRNTLYLEFLTVGISVNDIILIPS